MELSFSPSNPTIDDIQVYLVAHNGWSTGEFADFCKAHDTYINEDGTTLLERDQWTFLAAGFTL